MAGRDGTSFINDQDENNQQARSLKFIAGETEVRKVIALLNDKRNSLVSLYGSRGFEKSAIAIEVTQQLKENPEDNRALVIFSDLTTANNVEEISRTLCLDAGVNYEHDNPKLSLDHWLKIVKAKVIFVMDGIDNLLEENNRPDFNNFLHSLAMIGNCQMITTSRSLYQVDDLSIEQIDVEEMDENASMELLKKQCPENDDEFLKRLATLCGNIPLAMSIAASQIDDYEDSDKFLHYLKEDPYKTLERPESKNFVYRAINMSYGRLDEEQKEAVVRLATVEGSFNEKAAHVIIEKETLKITCSILQNLVELNLIKQLNNDRYSIHLLMKLFLKDMTGDNEQPERGCEPAMRAKYLMVKYYLKLGHNLTMQSYSKDGYKPNRVALKKEARNILNALKICCKQEDPTTSDISDCLARSKIYTTSARFFSLFVRTVIPGYFVDQFLERCAYLAQEREQYAMKIGFNCLLADQERSKTIEQPDESYISKMEEIKNDFNKYNEDLKQNTSLLADYHYQHGRYLSRKAESLPCQKINRLDLLIKVQDELTTSLKLKKRLPKETTREADKIFLLLSLGNIWKKISRARGSNPKNAIGKAEEYYQNALQLSQNMLGEHELTSTCLKYSGDLFLTTGQYALAEEKFTLAINMREHLGLQAGESHAFLLSNLGICLTKNGRSEEALDLLERARSLVEEHSRSDESDFCKAKIYANLAITHHSLENFSKDASKYAKKAMELKSKILGHDHEVLLKLSSHDSENYMNNNNL